MKSLKAYQIETLEREMVALIDHFAPDGVGDLNSERRFFKKFLSDLFSAFDADDSVAHGNCFTCLNQAETWAQLKACVTKHLEILVDSFDMYESYRRSVIAKAELFIERSFREEIAEKDLLSHLRVGKSWFTKVFKEKTGLTFSEYLCKRRVKEACRLLRTTDHSISRVAWDSGLRTERTLRRAFKKEFGISPRDYKDGQFVHKRSIRPRRKRQISI